MPRLADRSRLAVSAHRFQTVALAAVAALVLTIVSGAAVRLTGSGLGCEDWPSCTSTSVVAPLQGHAWIEFGNRLVNAVVTVAAIGAFAAALRRTPRRRDLTWLSFALVVGLVVEIVMGAVVVYTKLDPTVVSAHFLIGLAFVAVAVVLHHRSTLPDGPTERVALAGRPARVLGAAAIASLTVVAAAGTVVTSTGPHGGAPDTPRYPFHLETVARLHGSLAEVFVVVTVALLTVIARDAPAPTVLRRAQVMLAAVLAQGAIGYVQYFNGDPVGLVALHVAGASLLVVATLRLYLGMWDHRPVADQVRPYPGPDQAGLRALIGPGAPGDVAPAARR